MITVTGVEIWAPGGKNSFSKCQRYYLNKTAGLRDWRREGEREGGRERWMDGMRDGGRCEVKSLY